MAELLQPTDRGLYCPAGDFHVDPWKPVARAVITHAHSDHARAGSDEYYTAAAGAGVLRARLGGDLPLHELAYGESIPLGRASVSLHPAGHLLGSAQVRIECGGKVWVASGDYKTEPDATCAAFEPVPCDTFITESTFGLPVYRWPPQQRVFEQINRWWASNVERGRTSVLFAYALGKAQRVLSGLDERIGPILLHGAVERMTECYRAAGVRLPATRHADAEAAKATRGRAMVIAPLSANGSSWCRRFGPISTAFASGWMAIRGARRIRSVDRGFVLSDHVDWDGLMGAIAATGARRVGVTHGHTDAVVRWLGEQGLDAFAVSTRFSGERDDGEV